MEPAADPRRGLQAWVKEGRLPRPETPAEARAYVDEAMLQGLAGLLDLAVRRTEPAWPKDAAEKLASVHRALVYRGEQQLETAGRILHALREAGVPAIPLKGAAIALRLYDSVALRPMADVDILVQGDWPAALRVMNGLGLGLLERAHHAHVFEEHATRTVVELHHSLTSCPGLYPIEATRDAGAEETLLHLGIHAAFQHGLSLTLVQWLDFRRLLERWPVDGGRLEALAASAKAESTLATALRVAERVVGAPATRRVPASLLAHMPGRLSSRFEDPLSCVAPAPPPLARVRWELLAGRRRELLRRTLLPREPGSAPYPLGGSLHAIARAAGIAWRFLISR
jgi:hypothetical protein